MLKVVDDEREREKETENLQIVQRQFFGQRPTAVCNNYIYYYHIHNPNAILVKLQIQTKENRNIFLILYLITSL